MARGAWELAAGTGGVRETGLTALFKGASLQRQSGETTSVITALKDRTVLLYFAANWNEACKSFNMWLKMFYDIVVDSEEDSIAVIFVSNDDSREEQVAFFNDDSMHPDWFAVEWTCDLQDLLKKFEVTMIPSLLVVDQRGRAVVSDANQGILDAFNDGEEMREQAVAEELALARWMEWRRLAGDWRASSGRALGSAAPGAPGPAGSAAAPSPAPGAWAAPAAAPLAPDARAAPAAASREEMRARRLAALEERLAARSDVAAAAFGSPEPAPAAAGPAPAPGGVADLAASARRPPAAIGRCGLEAEAGPPGEAVLGLVAMGFEERRVRAALRRTGGDMEAAVSVLVAEG